MVKAGDKYADFLEEILRQTKENMLSWNYLDKVKSLYEGMNWTSRSTEFGLFGKQVSLYPDFDTENSFYCNIDKTYLVLLVRNNQPATFYVVPATFKNVVTLTADEYGNLITRLLNLVRSFFPDGEVFIDSILQKKKTE